MKKRIYRKKSNTMINKRLFQLDLFNGVDNHLKSYARFKDWYKDGGLFSSEKNLFMYRY